MRILDVLFCACTNCTASAPTALSRHDVPLIDSDMLEIHPPLLCSAHSVLQVSTKTNNPGELLQADAVVSERTATASVTTTVNYSVSVPSDTDQNKVRVHM